MSEVRSWATSQESLEIGQQVQDKEQAELGQTGSRNRTEGYQGWCGFPEPSLCLL